MVYLVWLFSLFERCGVMFCGHGLMFVVCCGVVVLCCGCYGWWCCTVTVVLVLCLWWWSIVLRVYGFCVLFGVIISSSNDSDREIVVIVLSYDFVFAS